MTNSLAAIAASNPAPPTHLARLIQAQHRAWAQALSAPACAGLEQAWRQAPMVVVCAHGAAYGAALSARVPFSAAAQLPLWVLHPAELEPMGAGLFKHAHLLIISFGADVPETRRAEATRAALGVARSYHCPVLLLTQDGAPAGSTAGAGRAPWALPVASSAADSHEAYALLYLGHLALAHAVALARAQEFGPKQSSLRLEAQAQQQALEAYGALADGLGDQLAQSSDWILLHALCARAPQVLVEVSDGPLSPAVRALAATRPHVAAAEPGHIRAFGPEHGGMVVVRVTAAAAGLAISQTGGDQLSYTLPWPHAHAALEGLWAHRLLGLLLPLRP